MISLKKLLAGVLSAAMVLGTMAIPAFADESTSGNAAKIGETEYATLANAVAAAKKDDTITMLGNVTESIVIENGNTITLDLNGYTLTNTGDANTITNNGTLEIVDSSADKTGKVKNENTSKAILFNAGGATATLNGGTFERTESKTYYSIKNLGTMTINEGVTVSQFNESSSAVANGCANSGEYTGSDVNLTINGGTFVQGLITIKNDECGVLEINGGSFENIKGNYTVFNWNRAVINDGTFKATYVVGNGKYNDYAVGDIDIKGGTFNGIICPDQPDVGYTPYPSEDISISGGTFSTDVSKYATADRTVMQNPDGTYTVSVAKIGDQGYSTLKDAVDAAQENETVTLLSDVTESVEIENGKTITLDLNGYTLTNTDGKHTIENNGTLTINDSSNDKTGAVNNLIHARGTLINHEGAVATLNGGKFYRSLEAGNSPDNNGGNSWYTILNQGTMTINDGATVENGGCYSANIRTDSELTVNGGTFKGGINTIKVDENGELTINDGNFSNEKATCIFNWNKTTINGGTFTRPNIANTSVCNGYWDPISAVGELTITGGTFNGVVGNYADYPGKIIAISGGTFPSQDVTEYTADGYYYDATDKAVKKSAAKVIDTAKTAGVKVTLDNLEKHSAIDKTADATYNVVLDTVKPEDKAKVDEIKNDEANAGKTVIAYDIYVAKTENGVTTEVENLENQKLTLSLPTAVKEGSGITVYHNTDVVQNVTLSADRKSVSFIAPSFSTYTFVYDAANLTADDITKNIKVKFEQVTDSEYDIVLKATDSGNKINGLLTADLTFSLAQGTTGLVNYEITPAANMSLLVNGNRYTFSFDGTNAHSATGDEIVIGKVKFNGYCTGANFKVDTSADAVNKLHTTEAVDSIVDEYLTNGDGINTGKLNAAASIDDINLTQETANLTVNVSFPNAIEDNAVAYQNMKVTVSGNGTNEVVELGSDNSNVTFANDTYTVEFTDKLVKGNTYTVTVSGAGYRTARYTVSMTGAKTLNFWNNVKDALTFVEENVGTGSRTNFLAGDIVKDGQINIYDLSAVVSYFGTDNLVENHKEYAKYDLNRDGVIDSMDISYVLVSWGK